MSQALASAVVPFTKKIFEGSREKLEKEIGYDFFGLVIKLAAFFFFAWILDQYMKAVAGQNNIIAKLFGALGGVVGFFISVNILDYFNKPQDQKIPYWTAVKGVAMFLVLYEAKQYYDLNETNKRPVSAFALGIFAIIETILAFATFPDLLQKLKEYNLVKGIGK